VLAAGAHAVAHEQVLALVRVTVRVRVRANL